MDFHMRHFIIPIFVPHLGCPHQCIFCNQSKISGVSSPEVTPDLLEKTVKEYIMTRPGMGRPRTQIAFYGGSFTGIDSDIQKSLLSKACDFIKDGQVDSLRISTRPDYIDPDTVRLLVDYGVETIELGVQSMVDRVLALSGRGHTSSHVESAVKIIKEHKLEVGLQIMPGLPGDNPKQIMYTVDRVIAMKPDFVRIYPTLVIKDTPLEELYSKGRFSPMTLDEAVYVCEKALLKLDNAHIPVVRLGLQPTPQLEKKGTIIAGPFHPSFRQLVESSIFFDMSVRLADRDHQPRESLRFRINSKDYSYFCGQKNRNISKLRERYGLKEIEVITEDSVKRNTVELINGPYISYIERNELEAISN